MGRTKYYGGVPGFIADENSVSRHPGAQIDWDLIPDKYRTTAITVKLNGAAAQGATSLTVDALAGKVPNGALLHFGESGEMAKVTATADVGDTTISVEALPNALEDDDEAILGGTGPKQLPAGKAMVQVTSGKLATRTDRPGSETAFGFLWSAMSSDDKSAAINGVAVILDGTIFEQLCADVNHADWATIKGEFATANKMLFVKYADDRG